MRCCNGSRAVGGVAPTCETLPARWLPQDAAMTQSRGTLWTVGHSTREWEVFAGMLGEVGIEVLADVRRFAGSRRHPQFSPLAMAPMLAAPGIAYVAMPEFGGRRTPQSDSPNGAWRGPAFRSYATKLATHTFPLAPEPP